MANFMLYEFHLNLKKLQILSLIWLTGLQSANTEVQEELLGT